MGSRRKGRILAFQGMFSYEMNPAQTDVLAFNWLEDERKNTYDEQTLVFASLLLKGTLDHVQEIDGIIRSHLEHWDFSRLNKVDLAVLRISVYSLLYQREIPSTVTINEAISISKLYGTDESYRFINGVLDSVKKSSSETKNA
ncbi:MAG: transcription antitermination factor NusB [Spirochaetales bacterium]|nr:transcription antitermination factor NusB [Spirochaetales bacterium]